MKNEGFIIIISLLVAFGYFIFVKFYKKKKWQIPNKPFPAGWEKILIREVSYYRTLTNADKKRFEEQVYTFLHNCKITGVDTLVDDTDKILIASSAIIPIFHFTQWQYQNIDEVLVYSGAFNKGFKLKGMI